MIFLCTILYFINFSILFMGKLNIKILPTLILMFLVFFMMIMLIHTIFLFSVDLFIIPKKNYCLRLYQAIESVLISSELVYLPLSLMLFLFHLFCDIPSIIIIKTIILGYKSFFPFVLLISYKIISDSDWTTSIKITVTEFLILNFISILFKYVI